MKPNGRKQLVCSDLPDICQGKQKLEGSQDVLNNGMFKEKESKILHLTQTGQ